MKRLRISLALVVVLLCLIAWGFWSHDVAPRDSPVLTQSAGEVTVWVNTESGVYHCPGTTWYGKTKNGRFMTQREAQAKGYRPAYGAVCG